MTAQCTTAATQACHHSRASTRTNGGDGGDDFSELELVQDGGFASRCTTTSSVSNPPSAAASRTKGKKIYHTPIIKTRARFPRINTHVIVRRQPIVLPDKHSLSSPAKAHARRNQRAPRVGHSSPSTHRAARKAASAKYGTTSSRHAPTQLSKAKQARHQPKAISRTARTVQPHHQDPHLLLAKEVAEHLGQRHPHDGRRCGGARARARTRSREGGGRTGERGSAGRTVAGTDDGGSTGVHGE